MKTITMIVVVMILAFSLNAENPFHQIEMTGAEGITYSEYNSNYYAVDADDGIIYEIDLEKNVSIFKDNLNTLMQPITIENLIYVSSNDPQKLHCYDLDNSNLIFELLLNFGGGIGGLTYVENQNAIYIVNQVGGLYKVNLEDNEITTISSTHPGNAVCYDETNNRLIIATWGNKLSEVDLITMEIAIISSTIVGNYTGITKSGSNYFLSHWGNTIYMYNEDLSEITVLINTNLNNPVGLYYNEPIDEFLVCNYYYNGNGNLQFYHISSLVSIQENSIIPEFGYLHQNFPNPFNPTTSIAFDLPQEGNVRIDVFNIKGQKVKILTEREFSAGYHKLVWNGKNSNNESVGSGIYFYKFTNASQIITKKMILLK